MKHLKSYENNNTIPKKGNYVLMSTDHLDVDVKNFINNNIGKIVNNIMSKNSSVMIKYENVPENIEEYFIPYRTFSQHQILYFSPNKEDVKRQLTANKFNL